MVKLSKRLFFIGLFATVCVIIVYLLMAPKLDKPNDDDNSMTRMFGRGLYDADSTIEPGQKADPNYIITLPLDHVEHTNFDIEWWYLTANLNDLEGNVYGVQWTLFRFKNPIEKAIYDLKNNGLDGSGWNNSQVYMAHASLHSMQNHWFGEKFARGGVGNAGVTAAPFSLFIDNWTWQSTAATQDLLPAELSFDAPVNLLQISITDKPSPFVSVKLSLKKSGPYVFHGDNGYSIKSGNQQHASHYYSAPFIDVSGYLLFDDDSTPLGKREVQITGKAWFDQEWTSQLLDTQTAGWDWMSLHLDDGSKLMAFRMRLNGQEDYITGSLISSDGNLRTLLPKDISLIPVSYTAVNAKELPLRWRLTVPSANIDIKVETLKKDQWNPALVSYYEGMVRIEGTHKGNGFLELTGY